MHTPLHGRPGTPSQSADRSSCVAKLTEPRLRFVPSSLFLIPPQSLTITLNRPSSSPPATHCRPCFTLTQCKQHRMISLNETSKCVSQPHGVQPAQRTAFRCPNTPIALPASTSVPRPSAKSRPSPPTHVHTNPPPDPTNPLPTPAPTWSIPTNDLAPLLHLPFPTQTPIRTPTCNVRQGVAGCIVGVVHTDSSYRYPAC